MDDHTWSGDVAQAHPQLHKIGEKIPVPDSSLTASTEYCTSTPSGVYECTSVHIHSHIPEQRGRTVLGTLLECGLFVLSSAKRKTVADLLEAEGVTPEALLALWRYIHKGEPEAHLARRYMAAILLDAERRKDAFAGVQAMTSSGLEDGDFGDHQRGFPCPYWTCNCKACNKVRSLGRPNEGPRPDYLFDGVAPPRERVMVDPNARGAKEASKDEDRKRLDHLIATCKAFEEAGRGIPGHIASLLIKMRRIWKDADIPPSVVEMAQRLDRSSSIKIEVTG